MTTVNLLLDIATVSTGAWTGAGDSQETSGVRSIQVGVQAVGAFTATVRISGANDGRFPQNVAEFTLSGNNSGSDACEVSFPWEFYRAEVVSITGSGARVTACMKV